MRRQPRATAVLLTLAALVAAGVTACTTTVAGHGTFGFDGSAPPAPTDPAQVTPQASGSPGPQPSATPPAPGTAGGFRGLRFTVPAGWAMTAEDTAACLAPSGEPPDACTLRILDVGASRAAGQPVTPPDPQADQGWYTGTGAPRCGPRAAVTGSRLVASAFVRMRNKTAAYGMWQVTCQDATLDFAPRLWWLPVTQVAFVQNDSAAAVDPVVDGIVASVTVDR